MHRVEVGVPEMTSSSRVKGKTSCPSWVKGETSGTRASSAGSGATMYQSCQATDREITCSCGDNCVVNEGCKVVSNCRCLCTTVPSFDVDSTRCPNFKLLFGGTPFMGI